MKTTRRQFLSLSAGALVSTRMSKTSAATAPNWIDAHVHVWNADTIKYPLAQGWNKDGLRASFTPETLLAECRPEGVSRIVLIQMSFYQFDNSYMLDTMRQHPGLFAGVAVIDENAPNLAHRMKTFYEQGVRGFRIYANAKNAAAWERSEGMQTLWREAADTRQSICCLADPDALPALSRLCRQYPETPVVIDHFARIGMQGGVDQKQLDALLKFADFKETTVKTSAFYALGKKRAPYLDLGPMIRQLRDAFGAKRLMWASDCPFQVEEGHTYRDSIALIRDRLNFLNEEEKEWILRRTAERVFFSPKA